MQRRRFLHAGAGALAGGLVGSAGILQFSGSRQADEFTHVASTRSIIPVVGDGKWVWNKPPQDETGYLEPRPFALKVGIEITGRGNATGIKATTPVPLPLPEQSVDSATINKVGCLADFRRLTPEAGQLILAAPSVRKGQKIGAVGNIRLTLHKQYHGFEKEQFPKDLPRFPREFARQYLYDSPGIQVRAAEVKDLAKKVGGQIKHPWDKALAFHRWVWENIRSRVGRYTSVVAAIRDGVGDCEEHASVFVALCRASGIPARLVWVPNHNWAEFLLVDEGGKEHWIPAHTSCYTWFGWTGAHELVLQKGDSIDLPEKRKSQRLLEDWMQWVGVRPEARWWAQLRPLPLDEGADPGPGARDKDEKGEWVVVGNHELDAYLRDGARAASRLQRLRRKQQ